MKEALTQALEALEYADSSLIDYHQETPFNVYAVKTIDKVRAAIAAAEAALAEPASIAEQAPVAWMYDHKIADIKPILEHKRWLKVPDDWEEVPLYTRPGEQKPAIR